MLPRKYMLAALVFALAILSASAQQSGGRETLVYIGSQADAILMARLDPTTGHITYAGQVTNLTRPTWLAIDPKRPILYSVSEIGNYDRNIGSVYSFGIDPKSGTLKRIGMASSEGHGPTFLSYDSRVSTLFVAHFGYGRVVAIPVRADGTLGEATSFQTDYGQGANKAKQPFAHAHQAILDPGGHFVLTPDMGTDRIFIYRYDAASGALSPANTPFFDAGPGTGPRHIVFSPDGRFVFALTELTAEIRTLNWDASAGQLRPVQAITINPPDFKGTSSAAEICISADGRFVYTSNRATNTFQVFAVDKSTGTLTRIQDIPAEGESPRSFAIDPSGRWMIVGNQFSNTLSVFAVDQATGKLSHTGPPIKVGLTPVAFAFYQP